MMHMEAFKGIYGERLSFLAELSQFSSIFNEHLTNFSSYQPTFMRACSLFFEISKNNSEDCLELYRTAFQRILDF
jgi:hypothetical protein